MDDRPGQSMAWRVQAADTVCVFPPQQCRRCRPTAAGEARWARHGQPAPVLRISRPRLSGRLRSLGTGEAQITANCSAKPSAETHRQAAMSTCSARAAPISAPTGRAPKVAVRITADTRAQHGVGRDRLAQRGGGDGPEDGTGAEQEEGERGQRGRGRARVSSIRALASSAHSGRRSARRSSASARRGASSAPASMPRP